MQIIFGLKRKPFGTREIFGYVKCFVGKVIRIDIASHFCIEINNENNVLPGS